MITALGLGGNKSLIWVEGDAEALSFDDNTMDGYTIAFGIRNVTHIEKVLAEAYRYVYGITLSDNSNLQLVSLNYVHVPQFWNSEKYGPLVHFMLLLL